MRSGWAGLIRAKAEIVRSSEHGADGSSLTVFSERARRQSAVAGFPTRSVSKFQQRDIASNEPAMNLILVTLRLERYTAQHIVSAR